MLSCQCALPATPVGLTEPDPPTRAPTPGPAMPVPVAGCHCERARGRAVAQWLRRGTSPPERKVLFKVRPGPPDAAPQGPGLRARRSESIRVATLQPWGCTGLGRL